MGGGGAGLGSSLTLVRPARGADVLRCDDFRGLGIRAAARLAPPLATAAAVEVELLAAVAAGRLRGADGVRPVGGVSSLPPSDCGVQANMFKQTRRARQGSQSGIP